MDTYILKIKDPVTGDWIEVPALKGKPGEKGDPFTYDDFTPEQLEALRGPRGYPGADNTFTAEYGVTTYAEIAAAYNAGQVVKCHRHTDSYEIVYDLAQLLPTEARFGVSSNNNVLYHAVCKSSGEWVSSSSTLELSSRKVNTISADSTTTQYPSAKAVYDYHDSTKMGEHKLTYTGTAIQLNGVTQTFAQVKSACEDASKFVYVVYENRLYIPQYLYNDRIYFTCTYPTETSGVMTRRIAMLSNGAITVNNTELAPKSYVDNAISAAITDIDTLIGSGVIA